MALIANLMVACMHGVNLSPQQSGPATNMPVFGAWAAIALPFDVIVNGNIGRPQMTMFISKFVMFVAALLAVLARIMAFNLLIGIFGLNLASLFRQ
jgi:hypothetical protein